jgi:hypothetical protein
MSSEVREESGVERRFRPGLTWRSALALAFSIALVQPAMIYGFLVTGIQGLGLAGQAWWPWIVILLWSELTRFLGQPLSKQELFIILSFQGMATLYSLFFIGPIYDMYIAYSAESKYLGISQYVPTWWVPSQSDAVRLMSSKYVFLDPAWILPIGVSMLSIVFGIMAMISVGYFTYAVYVKGQNLDFPGATATANTILSLAEREPRQMRIFMLAALFGVAYNTFVQFLPYVLGPFLSSGGLETMVTTSPIAADYDMTPYLANLLPGAGLIFSLNINYIIAGFLLPISISVYQFIGAIAFYFFGTQIITRLGLWPAECQYNTSWTYYTLEDKSFVYFYASVLIGLGIAVIIAPLILHGRSFFGAFKGIGRISGGGGGGIYMLLAIYLGSSMASVLMVNFLTGFPIWILAIFTIGGTLLTSFLSAAASGVTLGGMNLPFLPQLMIYFSGWTDKAIWFAAPPFGSGFGGILQIGDIGGASLAQTFKQADILEASKSEYLRTFIIIIALGIVSSFLFSTFLWTLSPIPSGAYPNTINYWPLGAAAWARWQKWVWTGYLFRRDLMLYSALIGMASYAITDLVLHQPAALISFIVGAAPGVYGYMGMVYSTSQMIGAVVANTFVKRSLEKGGKGSFDIFKGRFVIGFTVGWGFMATIRILLVLISRSMWLLPF